jgi:transcriptional regulator with XRE-family HTH domain
MPKRRWNSKALAERRRRVFNFYVAGFTQEEIAEKVGVHRSVVSRDLQSVRESACPGESPDVQEACFIQIERMIFNPGPGQFDPRHPPLEKTLSPEEAAASWKDRKIYDPTVDGYGP